MKIFFRVFFSFLESLRLDSFLIFRSFCGVILVSTSVSIFVSSIVAAQISESVSKSVFAPVSESAPSPLSTSSSREKLTLPRFVSIKSNEATLRSGASKNASILSIFVKKNEPIEIVAQFDNWRKVRDFDGEEGWIHSSLLSGKRYVVVSVNKNKGIGKGNAQNKPTKNKVIGNKEIKNNQSASNQAESNYLENIENKESGDIISSIESTENKKNTENNKQNPKNNSEDNVVETKSENKGANQPNESSNYKNIKNNIAENFAELKSDASDTSDTKAKLYSGLRCKLIKIDIDYCKIECGKISGWIKRDFLWGVYDYETRL